MQIGNGILLRRSTHGPIEGAVLDRLGDVGGGDGVGAGEVGDGAGDLEDAGVGAGGEAEPVGDELQHPVAGGVRLAELPDEAGGATVEPVCDTH